MPFLGLHANQPVWKVNHTSYPFRDLMKIWGNAGEIERVRDFYSAIICGSRRRLSSGQTNVVSARDGGGLSYVT